MDFKQKIRFLTSGYGKNHDTRIYRNSNNLQNYVEGLPINYWVVGDAAFRSFDNIKTAEQFESTDIFVSNCLKKQRVIVENAFALLFNKFRRFDNSQKNGDSQKYMRMLIGACVIHNMIIETY